MVAPPFVDLRSVASIVDSERIPIAVAAQHVNAHENGAHTGEVSVSMLQRLGVTWVLVGHSERRAMYAMDDAVVAATLRAVVRAGLRAVLCVGEALDVREVDEQDDWVRHQLRSALEGLDARYADQVTVAYEPIWAIGTGLTADVEQVRAMMAHVRVSLAALGPRESRVLYGGLGERRERGVARRRRPRRRVPRRGASLKAESFLAIVQACDDCYALKR